MRIAYFLLAWCSTLSFFGQSNGPNYAVDLVNPFIGTGGHGHTFPGATNPFGMVQLSPDTRVSPVEWDGCGGYHYSDSYIYGFSHTHLSGTGVADLCDVLVQPMHDSFSFDSSEYRSKFSHEKERAHAGFYAVHLNDEDIDVELTASPRAGMHRYTYNGSGDPWLVLDLDHRDVITASNIQVNDGWEIVGERSSSSWASDQRLFYCIQVNRPILEDTINGNKAAFKFDFSAMSRYAGFVPNRKEMGAKADRQLLMKVGISAVSIEGARKNLSTEIPHWDFDRVANEAVERWNDKLGKIKIKGGTKEQQRIFYTSLYHTYVAPYLFNDVDGNYRGMDGAIHHSDRDIYTVFSLWDTYRALHPLMTILEPEITGDWVATMLQHYQDGGRLPVWELWGNETDCMIGYHSVSVIADAYNKGLGGFDENLALEAMLASANRNVPGVEAMRKRGFIASEEEASSVSQTLEYAYDDACIATFIDRMKYNKKLGRNWAKDTLSAMRERGSAWQSLLDKRNGFFKARKNGGFINSFDPYEVNFHFTEANAWQYRLCIQQDVNTYNAVVNGKLEAYLDEIFTAEEKTTGRDQADITGLIGQYVHGNEPSHHMAYLYNYTEKPEKTRAYVKRILEEMYQDAPDGIIGNEDCGQMSAWYVLSAIGIYPMAPGVNTTYELGYPLFDNVSIELNDSTSFSVSIASLAKQKKARSLVGKGDLRITYNDIMNGAALRFSHDRTPHNMALSVGVLDGSYVSDKPCGAVIPGAPLINAASPSFTDELTIELEGCYSKCTIRNETGERPCPSEKSFKIYQTSTLALDWSEHFDPVKASFHQIDFDLSIRIESEFANQYAAGGERALIDGIKGSLDFRTGDWQGYQGQDVVFEVDLGNVKRLDSIALGMLQDQNSWIWYPEFITIETSQNKRQWSSSILTHQVSRKADGGMTKDLSLPLEGRKVQWIRVTAKNAGPCPEWHLGAGGKSWIFLDELSVYEKK